MGAGGSGRRRAWAWGLVALASLGVVAGCGGGGSPPRVAEIAPQVAVVGQSLVVQIQASDPDDDPLTYAFRSGTLPDLAMSANILVTPDGMALFSWRPIASDLGMHTIEFVVSDGEHDTVRMMLVEVRGAVGEGSLPTFRKPVGDGLVHNLGAGECVPDVRIEIDDPDSSSVVLTVEPPIIPNSDLTASADGLEGLWTFCPDAAQRATAAPHVLTLSADDGDNPPTIKRYSVWLRRASEDCPSMPPSVSHTPTNGDMLADPVFVVNATDDVGLAGPPILFWSTQNVALENMQVETMEPAPGPTGTYYATVPNPAIPMGVGSSVTIYYAFGALDEDACFGTSPADGTHQMTVTHPGGTGAGVCQPCSYDAQCGDAGDLCLVFGVDARACGHGCLSEADCEAGYTCSPNELTSVEGATGRQCIPTGGVCVDSGCEDDDSEPNDNLVQGLESPPFPEGQLTDRVLCSLDDDYYRVDLASRTRISAALSGNSMPDLDLMLLDDTGQQLGLADSFSSEELLESGCLDPGTYVLRVFSLFEGNNDYYELAYVLVGAGC